MKKRKQQSSQIGRRLMVALLALIMLISVCVPGLTARASTEETGPAEPTSSPVETMGSEETQATEPEETKATEPEETQATEPEETKATEPEETQATEPEETTAPTETQPEPTAFDKVMADLTALEEEAKTLEAEVEVLDEFTARLRDVWNDAYDLNEEGRISDEELEAIDAKGSEILAYLKDTYGYENGKISLMEVEVPVAGALVDKNSHKVEGVAENVKINLFNYDSSIDTNANAVFRFKAQAKDSSLYGRDAYKEDGSDDMVHSDGGNNVATPTMKLNLQNGYPYVKSAANGGSIVNGVPPVTSGSLAYLFDPLTQGVTGRSYHEVENDGKGTGLFLKDNKGYYYYDSADNHAEYDASNKSFQLYDFALRPYGGRVQNRGQGHFLPFNTDLSEAIQLTDENRNWVVQNTDLTGLNETEAKAVSDYWTRVNLWDTANSKISYVTDSNNGKMGKNVWVLGNTQPSGTDEEIAAAKEKLPDYWLGMSVEFTFNVTAVNDEGRPVIVSDETGEVQDMIFSFLGDDDVFVYVDDVLILDLGGGSCDYGEINFTTGKTTEKGGSKDSVSGVNNITADDLENGVIADENPSTANDKNGQEYWTVRDIGKIFQAAIYEADADEEADADSTKTYSYDEEFKQYSTHTLKFFYLERGTGTSNNELRFNMEPMPAGNVNITKSLTEDSVLTDGTKNDEYTFELVKVLDDGTEKVCGDAEYVVGTIDGLKTDDQGQFKLKAGQMASFTTLEPAAGGTTFRVYEVDDGENADFNDASYSGSNNGSVKEENGKKFVEFTIYPTDKDSNITHTIDFTNQLKTSDFSVYKKVTGNMGDWSKDFDFTATLYTTADGGTKIAFPEGTTYTVTDGVAQFTLKNGEKKIFENIPLGAYVVVTEENYTTEDNGNYTTKVKVDNGAETETLTISFVTTLTKDDSKVEFTNRKDVTIDTGVVLESLPYIVILGGVAVVALIMILRRKKRYED